MTSDLQFNIICYKNVDIFGSANFFNCMHLNKKNHKINSLNKRCTFVAEIHVVFINIKIHTDLFNFILVLTGCTTMKMHKLVGVK